MSVKVRPYHKRGKRGFEVDIVLRLPSGEVHRERVKSPVASKSGSKFWGEQRALELLRNGVVEAPPEAPTFGDFFARFLAGHSVANREKPSSIDSKQRIWKNYLCRPFANTRLDELAAEDVQQLKGRLAELSPKTVNNALSLLSGMLKAALEWGVISELPVRIRMLKARGDEVSYFQPEEYERLVDVAGKLDPQIQAVVLLGGDAGLRSGEMLGLRWGDIDFARAMLHIRRAIWRDQVTLPKSGKGRVVPMTRRLQACLKAQRHQVREEVLHRPGGEQATRATVHKWLKRAEREAGLLPLGALHTLRHTFCSRLARQGAPAAAIQQLAGHSSYSTTARYVHLFEGAKESAIRLLEASEFGDILETGLSDSPPAGLRKEEGPETSRLPGPLLLRGVGDLNLPWEAPQSVGRAESDGNTKRLQHVTEATVGTTPTSNDILDSPDVANVARNWVAEVQRLELAIFDWRRTGDLRVLRRALLRGLSELGD